MIKTLLFTLFLCFSLKAFQWPWEKTEEEIFKEKLREIESVSGTAKPTEEVDAKKIGDSYLEKIRKRYVSHMPFVMVPILIIPVVKNNKVHAYLTLSAELKCIDVESYRTVRASTIPIKDAIFSSLYKAMSILWVGPHEPNPAVLEKRIKKIVNKYFKKNTVEDVIIHFLQLSYVIKPD